MSSVEAVLSTALSVREATQSWVAVSKAEVDGSGRARVPHRYAQAPTRRPRSPLIESGSHSRFGGRTVGPASYATALGKSSLTAGAPRQPWYGPSRTVTMIQS